MEPWYELGVKGDRIWFVPVDVKMFKKVFDVVPGQLRDGHPDYPYSLTMSMRPTIYLVDKDTTRG